MLVAVLIDELAVEPPDDLLGAADLRAVCSRAVVEVDGVHSREAYETAVAAFARAWSRRTATRATPPTGGATMSTGCAPAWRG